MKAGDMVTYSPTGPLGHVLAGCPGLVVGVGGPGTAGHARVLFGAILESVVMGDLAPARIWWRKGAGLFMGPYDSPADARRTLWRVCSAPDSMIDSAFAALAVDPNGTEIVSGGYRYRLAWGTDAAPERYG